MDKSKNWLQKMQVLCSKKEYCTSEIIAKLPKDELSPEEIQEIINKLKKENYLNEHRYVSAFVHDKLFYTHWGKIKIRYALMQKYIDTEIISEVMDSIDKNEYIQLFVPVARAKWKAFKKENASIKKQKTIKYLMSKGLEYDIAASIVEVLKEK